MKSFIVFSIACTMKKYIKNDKLLNILKVKYRGNIWKKLEKKLKNLNHFNSKI